MASAILAAPASNDTVQQDTARGVGYWRMSSSDQERSIPQQRAEMLPRCRLAGITIEREFQDEGISGGGMARRDAFQDMLRYCQQRHRAEQPVDCIACWDTSRFSRATSTETGHFIWELQQAGVHRLFTAERWYDFRKEEDRAIFLLQQDFTNNRYLRNLSAGVLRGKKEVATAGYFTGGMVPYGFDRLLIDDKGRVAERIRRGEKITLRRKGWHLVLAPIPADDDDPARQLERQTAVWLFEQFATRNVSYRTLARELNDRGVPGPGSHYHRQRLSPGQSRWTVAAVKGILTNCVYCGMSEVGTVAKGAYHRLSGREVVAVAPGAAKTYHNTDTIRAPLEHGGVVDEPLWRLVQEKAAERSKLRTFARTGGYVRPVASSTVATAAAACMAAPPAPAGVRRCMCTGSTGAARIPSSRANADTTPSTKRSCSTRCWTNCTRSTCPPSASPDCGGNSSSGPNRSTPARPSRSTGWGGGWPSSTRTSARRPRTCCGAKTPRTWTCSTTG
jgi:DNA invertase Pin-like site-specific DNA recombinase